MPEGDTIHYAANRIRPVLEGHVPDELRAPHPRHGADRWPQRLEGRRVESVDAHGKHLFLRFEGDLVLHSHLRMTGSWRVIRQGQRWPKSPRRAWLYVRRGIGEVLQFNGPVLELLTAARARGALHLAALGPDICTDAFDVDEVLRRLRADDPTRPIGDALLDQRVLAGIGNMWKVETCHALEISPWRRTGDTSDLEVRAMLAWAHPRMQESAREGTQSRFKAIYPTKGRPCPRCGTAIAQRGQWDDNRPTYWCPGCQA